MKLRNNTSYSPGRLGCPLGRRDWAYVLGLLVPLVVYDLASKGVRVASLSDEQGLLGPLQPERSDLLFNPGYALLWVGLFAAVKASLWRVLAVGLFHVVTILLALLATAAVDLLGRLLIGSSLEPLLAFRGASSRPTRTEAPDGGVTRVQRSAGPHQPS